MAEIRILLGCKSCSEIDIDINGPLFAIRLHTQIAVFSLFTSYIDFPNTLLAQESYEHKFVFKEKKKV